MNDPRTLSIKDYTYFLPDYRIAQYPLANRDDSRLLIYKQGNITEDVYKNIAGHIPGNSLLIFNNTRVLEARLLFQKATGGIIEIFCLGPHEQYADITHAMMQKEKVYWHCLVGGASKWKRGQVLEKKVGMDNSSEIILRAAYVEKRHDDFIIELSWNQTDCSFAEILHFAGAIPLPPYMKREPEITDAERYQTIYAQPRGSVAAPTAGLHFTQKIFNDLREKNIPYEFITLHVGAGTFKPVKSETIGDHEMHAEYIDVTGSVIELLLDHQKKNIVAVGTTSFRTLESLYWLGVKLSVGSQQSAVSNTEVFFLGQWEPYSLENEKIPVEQALNALLARMKKNNTGRLLAKTQLLMAPGYQCKMVNGLITNFHQPQSTLLLLVASFVGKDWKKIYEYALENGFRFLSYGDGCLLWAK